MDIREPGSIRPEQLHTKETAEHKDGGFEGVSETNSILENPEVPKEAGEVAVHIAGMGLENSGDTALGGNSLELPTNEAKARALEELLHEVELSETDATAASDLTDKVNGIMES